MESIQRDLRLSNLPTDLAYLPMIESGFTNDAVSPKGAVGLWQLMPETAKEYGLRVDAIVDERREPGKATEAAIRHLGDLSRRFDSPFLVAAAYNGGAGRISRALQRLERDSSKSPDSAFFHLTEASLLARETAEFVPRFIATALIAKDPARYGIRKPPRRSTSSECDSIMVKGSVPLARIARAAGLSVDLLHSLNPQYLQGRTPAGAPSIIRLPKGSTGRLAEGLISFLADSPADAHNNENLQTNGPPRSKMRRARRPGAPRRHAGEHRLATPGFGEPPAKPQCPT
jgi:membrane-bound lytic murein transglycosylase D